MQLEDVQDNANVISIFEIYLQKNVSPYSGRLCIFEDQSITNTSIPILNMHINFNLCSTSNPGHVLTFLSSIQDTLSEDDGKPNENIWVSGHNKQIDHPPTRPSSPFFFVFFSPLL